MKKIISIILCSLFIFTLAGCARSEVKKDNDTKVVVNEAPKEEPKVEAPEVKVEVKESREVVLYFSDDQAMYLVGEKRNLEGPTAKSIVAELIKGPSEQSKATGKIYETLPADLEILDVQVKEGIANVDFKANTTDKISGGSTGEAMALYSIINTLVLDAQLGVTKVQFLIEGKKVESIKGHFDVTEPMSEDKEKIKK